MSTEALQPRFCKTAVTGSFYFSVAISLSFCVIMFCPFSQFCSLSDESITGIRFFVLCILLISSFASVVRMV
jgi:hypothetical protein